MDWPRLDTSSWNLSLGVAATSMLAACGPFVIPEGETDSDSVTDTDPSPTNPSETDTAPPVQCNSWEDCGPGYDCIGNVCVPYDYCEDGGCCYGGTGGCCYYDCCYGGDCWYYECYSDEDCGPQGLCVTDYGYNACAYPYELSDCGTAPQVVPVELPVVGEGELVSLSFVDVDGDAARDLVVGRAGTVELHRGANAAPPGLLPLPAGASVVDATSGDFDADGDADLVLATLEGSLLMLAGDGLGGFSLVSEVPLGQPVLDLVALQWNGDGALDVAYRGADGGAQLQINDGSGWLGSGVVIPTAEVVSLAPTDFGGDAYGDLVLQDGSSTVLYLGDFSGDLTVDGYLPGQAHGQRQVFSGSMNQGQPQEVIGYTLMSGWQLIELWPDTFAGVQRFSLTGDEWMAGTGDFDADGVADVIAVGGSVVSYVRGSADRGYPTLECRSTYFSGVPTSMMAVGDFDGNLRADVVVDGGGIPVVMLTL